MDGKERNEVHVKKGGDLKTVEEFELISNAVCLLKSDKWTATGFFVNLKCKDAILMGVMTNNHVVALQTEVKSGVVAIFKFNNYQRGIPVNLWPDLFFYTDPNIDFSFFGIDYKHLERVGIQPIQCVIKPPKLEDILQGRTSFVTVFQHPQGWPKCYSQHHVGSIIRPYFTYFADTDQGSSGSPVFIHIPGQHNLQLIGIHKSGLDEKYNKGVLMDEIMTFLSQGQYTWPPNEVDSGVPEGKNGDAQDLFKEIKQETPDLIKIEELLKNVSPNVQEKKTSRKMRPLHYAVKNKNEQLVQMLLKHGADPNLPDGHMMYPLHLVAETDRTDIAKLLIDSKADVEVYTENVGQDTPLHFAARTNQADMIKFLVHYGKADVNARNKANDSDGTCGMFQSKTPLIVAAEIEGNIDAVKALIECKADVKVTGNTDETPYMIAVSKEHIEIAECLKAAETGSVFPNWPVQTCKPTNVPVDTRHLKRSLTEPEMMLQSVTGMMGSQGGID